MPTKAQHAAVKRRGHELYDVLLAAQGGKCAICERGEYTRRFCVDHDHRTLEIRGLLCFLCNYFVVKQGSTPQLLRAAAAYLENPPAPAVLANHKEAS